MTGYIRQAVTVSLLGKLAIEGVITDRRLIAQTARQVQFESIDQK
ncbi:hypothetical protein GARC_2023 [Paraglaciecola arctica BSs20135]|uniref:Uncharacterized protein n=1 Tax=Paraglaciecola arctica BSs20135 TaxID=493475 RepID=K6Z6C3_9ALTE|nr:hypothetical protein GARC_2023 [Paraglaciecola arctica BSs20135]